MVTCFIIVDKFKAGFSLLGAWSMLERHIVRLCTVPNRLHIAHTVDVQIDSHAHHSLLAFFIISLFSLLAGLPEIALNACVVNFCDLVVLHGFSKAIGRVLALGHEDYA